MTVADSRASLLDQVRSGNRQLQTLAAEGLLPVSFEQLVPLQVFLARGGDPDVAARAARSLAAVDPGLAVSFLAGEADAEVLAWFAEQFGHPLLVEAILRRRDVPRAILIDLAPRLSPDLQEILLLRQDAIVEEPAILEALEENPQLSLYSQRRIGEYREHLLPRERSAPVGEFNVGDVGNVAGIAGIAQEEEMDEEAFVAAVAAVRAAPAIGEIDEQTRLSEGQIRMLPLPARMKLTRGASRPLRNILVRDNNARVAISILANNAVSEQEVEAIARNRSVVEEVLTFIGRRREWAGKTSIQRALAQNPRTPVAMAVRIVPKLSVRDLRDLGRDKNIPDAVRTLALRLYRIKRQ
ncbi:MAG TPA: hypothetical protein VGR07_18105 [Thermoanaerobaculia bacterium]|nr:hypothetical protein [Thermoanaerobaculia bacterium]